MAFVNIDAELIRKGFHFQSKCNIQSRITGIFGPSGSGKTTFLHLLAGLQEPTNGIIQVNGNTLNDTVNKVSVPSHKRKVGYVFQEGRIFPHLNVKQNLQYAFSKHHNNNSLFEEIVDLLELGKLLKNMPSQLSGGQNQRVALGRALLSNCKLLLLDEPFTALDFALKNQVITFINRIINHLDIPMIIVSHDLKDLLMLTQNLVLIKNGKTEAPQAYIEIIQKQKLLELNGLVNNYYNIYDCIVDENDQEKGLAVLIVKDNPHIKIFVENDNLGLYKSSQTKVSLRGADVALSSGKVENISIRNQLPGIVKTVFQHKNHIVCIVDCGIPVITRLTIDSAKKLALVPGKMIWCLFKSLAIEAYH